MSETLGGSVRRAVADAVPFLVITALWILVMLVVYGLFLLTKPSGISYAGWVHASVFAIPAVGFLGHVLQQALKGGREG